MYIRHIFEIIKDWHIHFIFLYMLTEQSYLFKHISFVASLTLLSVCTFLKSQRKNLQSYLCKKPIPLSVVIWRVESAVGVLFTKSKTLNSIKPLFFYIFQYIFVHLCEQTTVLQLQGEYIKEVPLQSSPCTPPEYLCSGN